MENRNLANIEKLELIVGSTGVVSSSANTWNCIVDTRNINSLYVSGDFSLLSDNALRTGGFNEYPEVNSQGTRLTYLANGSMNTSSYDYVMFCFLIASGATIDDIKNSFLIEIGNTGSSYVPHAEQNAPLTLGNIELYEGDEIEIDYVQKAGYKKVIGANKVKNMGKVVLDGSENWIYFTTTNKPLFYIETDQENINYKVETNLTCFSNNFKGVGQKTSFDEIYDLGNNSIGFRTAYPRLAIRYDDIQNKDDFKTFLSTHNTEVVYPRANPVIIPITDTTFLAQLETLINMKTYKEVTNIESTGEDLAPVLDCTYYQDISTIRTELATINARLDLLEE